jgi:hypothetical protein
MMSPGDGGGRCQGEDREGGGGGGQEEGDGGRQQEEAGCRDCSGQQEEGQERPSLDVACPSAAGVCLTCCITLL